jgi:hypothetical protein
VTDGGKSCSVNTDCNNGSCLATVGGFPPPFCQCNPGYACSDCSQKISDLASHNAFCPGV